MDEARSDAGCVGITAGHDDEVFRALSHD
ncbi:hypothetical protein QTP70_024961, partial [Hemibagrus guttatus]